MTAALAAQQISHPPAKEIPTTFASSVKAWWAAGNSASAISEERLLRRLPFFVPASAPNQNPQQPVTARIRPVELDSPKRFINTLSFVPATSSPSAPPPTVLLHGYGAGLGFFFLNYESIGAWCRRRGSTFYSLDWLGMGRSARPPFKVTAKKGDTAARVQQAESFFVDALEEWRAKMGLAEMTFVGHSLGGYLSVAYALKHPSRVRRIVLLSPAGVPHDPEAADDPAQELDPSPHGAAPAQPASESNVKAARATRNAARARQSTLRRLGLYLWEEGYSPFAVVRTAGVLGPLLVGKYSSRRFEGLSDEETRDMHDYILNITIAKGSGEYCISHILAPGAFARRPLVDRIDQLKIPITFVYGDHDWMDPAGGTESIKRLKAAGNRQGRMYVVPNAGHHVYLDNPRAVDELLVQELDRPLS